MGRATVKKGGADKKRRAGEALLAEVAATGGKIKRRKEAKVADEEEQQAPEEHVAKTAAPAASGAVKQAPKPALFQLPEAAEVLEISRTQNLYKSNLFRLQLDELLKELKPTKSSEALEAFLRSLKPTLEGLKTRTVPKTFAEEYPQLCFHMQRSAAFNFSPPKRIDIVGSHLLGTALRSSGIPCVDVAVEMPAEAFENKDFINHRYADRRSVYVGELQRQLGNVFSVAKDGSPLHGADVHLESFQGDLLRPCLVLSGGSKAGTDKAQWKVRLLPVFDPTLWAPTKLAPDRNSVRGLGGSQPEVVTSKAVAEMAPTAHYNSCVLEDARMRAHLQFLHEAMQTMPALRDTILLLKRWALARGFLQLPNSTAIYTPLTGFCLSMLAAHASQTAGLAPAEASFFQLFKLSLSALASVDWATQKLALGKSSPAALTEQERRACRAHFYDSDGMINFFWRLGPFIQEIQSEAKRALRILDVESDPFEAVFGQVTSPELMWDLVIRTPPLGKTACCPGLDRDAPIVSPEDLGCMPEPVDVPEAMALADRLRSVLKLGLGDRCLHVNVRLVGCPPAWISEMPSSSVAVLVGLNLEASNMDRSIDKGPAPNDSKAVTLFRATWGSEKSEMRRFKDGSILECVVWTKPDKPGKVESQRQPAVITQIVRHLVDRHVPKLASDMDVVSGPTGLVPNLDERTRRLWVSFEACRTHICQLSSLPLSIKDIHPGDAGFSYTQVAPRSAPLSSDGTANQIERPLHDIVVEFEASGRWPSDSKAAQKVGCALLLQMREELKTDLGVEAGVTEDFLDIQYPEAVFRVRIFHPHEHFEVAGRVTNFQAEASAPLPSDDDLERLRMLWWRPRVCSSLHGHVLQRPAFAGAARLCKQWMASQMLSGYEEFIEHLVASVFLQPAPFEAPSSPQVGFCRVLWLLSAFDWKHEPLIVDFDEKLSQENRLSMRQSFEAGHKSAGRFSTFWVSSRWDPHSILLPSPPATVCAWLCRRAQQALGVYSRRLLNGPGVGVPAEAAWQGVFALDTSAFDILVSLPSHSASATKGLKSAQRHAAASSEAFRQAVSKLRAHLSPVSLVFHGSENKIALKWRPSAYLPQPQSVLMGTIPHTMVPPSDAHPLLCVPNVLCLTSAIFSLLEGLAIDVRIVGGRG